MNRNGLLFYEEIVTDYFFLGYFFLISLPKTQIKYLLTKSIYQLYIEVFWNISHFNINKIKGL
jgi:hypothetical protein